jgi:hypothetical protein
MVTRCEPGHRLLSTVDRNGRRPAMAELDSVEVTVRMIVSRELTFTTTADAVRAELLAAGLPVVMEPSDLDSDHDATEVVFGLLEENDGIHRDAWLLTLASTGQCDIEDETISIEEVNEV